MTPASRPTSAYRIRSAGDTHIGSRQYNEDSVLIRPDLQLFLLADGAGGHNAGNVASALATTSIAHSFEETEEVAAISGPFDPLGLATAARRLATAVQRANREIIDVARNSDRHRGMGTTIVAIHAEPDRGVLHVAHVGDSRCYRLREGRLELLTHDHTLLNDVLEMRPDLPEAEAIKLPRNVITRALGMSDNVRVAIRSHELAPGDRYLLCSDGLTDVVSEAALGQLLSTGSVEDQAAALVLAAIDAGASDNVAVVTLACDVTSGEAPRASVRPQALARAPSERPPATREDDYPEIIVLEDDVHVVPTGAGRPDVKRTMEQFLIRRSSPPRATDEGDDEG